MRLAFNIPNFGDFADPRLVAELAAETEAKGWDGFFVWDHLNGAHIHDHEVPIGDPWVILTAIALATERIQFGPMVTSLPRRRPAVVARQTATIDRLSGGRLVLGVGLGGEPDREFGDFGEPTDARVRADMLDEALEVITRLWTGERVSFEGEHYQLRDVAFTPTPVQQPRIPIWVAGAWPNKRPLRRAARWDGVYPMDRDTFVLKPEDLADAAAYTKQHIEDDRPFEVVGIGAATADPDQLVAQIRAHEAAGATSLHLGAFSAGALRAAIEAGPPSI